MTIPKYIPVRRRQWHHDKRFNSRLKWTCTTFPAHHHTPHPPPHHHRFQSIPTTTMITRIPKSRLYLCELYSWKFLLVETFRSLSPQLSLPFRALPRIKLRPSGWACLGGVCDHIWLPHQRNKAVEGMGGRWAERAWGEH